MTTSVRFCLYDPIKMEFYRLQNEHNFDKKSHCQHDVVNDVFYSILSHNLGRSSGHHRWIRNNPFPSWHVFSCPSWAGKVYSCPLFDIVFPPLLLPASFFFFLSLCPVGLSLLNQKTLRHGQTILASVSWPRSGVRHILQWLLGSFCEPPNW